MDPTSDSPADDRFWTMASTLERHGQDHLVSHLSGLDVEARDRLISQLESLDWDELSDLIESHVRTVPESLPHGEIRPAPYFPKEPPPELASRYAEARAAGERVLRDGKVALFTVAGGQGTRLGWDGPKGSFPASPVRGRSLFGLFADTVRKAQEKYGATLPWYVMTSPVNDAATRAFFADHDYFGLDREGVTLFQQGTMPSLDLEGRLLLAAPDGLAVNPDGHGGSLGALRRSGALDDMERRGVEQISYLQVDNPNVHPVDPLFLGLHVLEGADMSSKMLPKRRPDERVGNFCLVDGRMSVIEYSDMPDELAEARDEDGSLRFMLGSIAIHVLSVAFARRLTEGARVSLPFHRAEKKVPHLDLATGRRVEPGEPNAIKLERFIFDALPLTEASIVLETDRVEEFAPIKNAEGDDSPETSRRLQVERAARWLARHGVEVARTPDGEVDALIEISPLTAIEADDLAHVELPERVEAGARVVL